MLVAAVQFKPVKSDKARSLERIRQLATTAAHAAELVVLPEMAATGYVFESPEAIDPVAEPSDGPTFETLAEVAALNEAWIVAGEWVEGYFPSHKPGSRFSVDFKDNESPVNKIQYIGDLLLALVT